MDQAGMRVLMTADVVGGVWQYATDLAAGLAQHGVETTLAVLGPGLGEAQAQAASNIPGLRLLNTGLPLDWLSDAASTRAAAASVAALARAERVDIVHLNSPALAAGQSWPVPVLAAAHGCLATWWDGTHPGQPLDPAFAWHAEMMTRALRACDRVVAPSASHARMVQRRYGLSSPPHVVHNGRAVTGPVASGAQQDCAFTAGRLWDDAKNIRTLDAAAALLPFPVHAAGPVIAPHGQAVELESIHLLGTLNGGEMARWLGRRPVFVTCATFEPFGLAVLEAALSGCALVLSDIPTFRELWDGAALFAPADDPVQLAGVIEDAVQDAPLREWFGKAAQARAQSYTAGRMAAETAGHYRELLQARLAA